MRNSIDESYLYTYIQDAENVLMEHIPEEESLNHTFSNKFNKKMKKLIKYEQRSKTSRVISKISKVAALALLITALLNTVLICSVQAYRNRFFEVIKTVTEQFTSYYIESDTPHTANMIPKNPKSLPEGFTQSESVSTENLHFIEYTNNAGQYIEYYQEVISDGVMNIDTESADTKHIQVLATTIYNVSKDGIEQFYWYDNQYLYSIIGNTNYDDMLFVIENIIAENK